VKGESGTEPGDVAFTGSTNIPWFAAAMFVLLLVGSFALRIGSRKATAEDPER
jgi:LPXTG-motif cell wall-anchored protein